MAIWGWGEAVPAVELEALPRLGQSCVISVCYSENGCPGLNKFDLLGDGAIRTKEETELASVECQYKKSTAKYIL